MSDLGRKSNADKLGDKLQPDSSKSTLDKVGDSLTGAGDKVARDVVPDSQKSTSQSLSDKADRTKDSHTGHNAPGQESLLDKAKDAVGMGNKHT
nr:hypothetical protein B0A51_15491 [Rachicladosporium sp. CCFEE 5018]